MEAKVTNGLTLTEAFEQLVSKRMWWVGVVESAELARYIKRDYRRGTPFSEERMKEILRKAGYKVAQPELWEV